MSGTGTIAGLIAGETLLPVSRLEKLNMEYYIDVWCGQHEVAIAGESADMVALRPLIARLESIFADPKSITAVKNDYDQLLSELKAAAGEE